MTGSWLRLNVDCRCRSELVSFFKMPIFVNVRIIHTELLPLLFYWCKAAIVKGRVSAHYCTASSGRFAAKSWILCYCR
jgi:hypothetical protein